MTSRYQEVTVFHSAFDFYQLLRTSTGRPVKMYSRKKNGCGPALMTLLLSILTGTLENRTRTALVTRIAWPSTPDRTTNGTTKLASNHSIISVNSREYCLFSEVVLEVMTTPMK